MTGDFILSSLWGEDGRGANYILLHCTPSLRKDVRRCLQAATRLSSALEGHVHVNLTAKHSVWLFAYMPDWLEAAQLQRGLDPAVFSDPIMLFDLQLPDEFESVPPCYGSCGFECSATTCYPLAAVKHEDGDLTGDNILEALAVTPPTRNAQLTKRTT